MMPERWQQIQDVLEKALELGPEQRSAYLNQVCASDPSLRKEVETLLASSDDVRSSFLQSSSTPRVTLPSGTKLGEYEVKSLLGSGGMGEVYRARDARLGRDVAIKVLPPLFSADSERLRRFEQEARAAAALNHPNILAVFQMGTYEGAPFLVSELLEGETLREQIQCGRLPVRKTIDYATQIARGLAAAHEKGIVHRDLKPENLFVTKDGRVKILDFGLAKLTQTQSSSEPNAPTLTEGTETGVVMGTVGYMSPEQVRAQPTDYRTDIFAFGAILYEMLTGKRAFQKTTSADTMSAILNEDPPAISQITTNIPPALQRVVQRCLEKNPEQRFQSASDLAFALDALSETSSSAAASSNQPPRKISKLWAVAAVLAAVLVVALVVRLRSPRRPEPKHELVERQLTANPPENAIAGYAISRDGKYLAYSDSLSKNLYLLAIDSGEIREVPLLARYDPWDWFPDGNHLVMNADDGSLWKVSIWNSSLQKLWGGDASNEALSLDGSHFAIVNDSREIWLTGADGEDPRKILASDAPTFGEIVWSPSGQRLAYVRYRGAFAKREVTIETCDLTGGAGSIVLSDPHLYGTDGTSSIAWLPDGRIIYSIFSEFGASDLWAIAADPNTGQRSGDPTRLTSGKNFRADSVTASADGKRLIVKRQHDENSIYIGDVPSGNKAFTPHRFTPDDWHNVVSDWTKDSKAILFFSKRNDRWSIFKQNIDAKTPETLIAGPENYIWPKLSTQGALLYTAAASPAHSGPGPVDLNVRLMSAPEPGGTRSTLMKGQYSYACGSSPSSSCVGSQVEDRQLVFFHLDPVKGRGEEITRIAGYQSGEPRFGLSPDGSKLAIVDYGQRKGEIRIVNLSDRRVTVLPVRDWKWSDLAEISWAADGKSWFVFAEGPSNSLLSVDANGNPRVLYEMPAAAGLVWTIVPSPDGKRLAFTKRLYAIDVMLLENF
jgi:eukaryotic-like serine/threonine-protein kinase